MMLMLQTMDCLDRKYNDEPREMRQQRIRDAANTLVCFRPPVARTAAHQHTSRHRHAERCCRVSSRTGWRHRRRDRQETPMSTHERLLTDMKKIFALYFPNGISDFRIETSTKRLLFPWNIYNVQGVSYIFKYRIATGVMPLEHSMKSLNHSHR